MELNNEKKIELDTNEITIVGQVETLDGSFEHKGIKFNKATIRVERLSGAADYIPVVYKASKGNFNLLDKVIIRGTVRTRNEVNSTTGKHKLYLYVFVSDIQDSEMALLDPQEYSNRFSVIGYTCKPVVCRKTPKGITVCDIMLAYNSTYKRSFYIPAIAFGKVAKSMASKLTNTGMKIQINGRFQSRDYNKTFDDGTVMQFTAYELAISDYSIVSQEE